MNGVVVYGSRNGNTEKVAFCIAEGLRSQGSVQLYAVEEAPSFLIHSFDLIVIGGPTEGHGMSEALAAYLSRIGGAFNATPAATFDTRLRWPLWLSGSAAARIAGRLRTLGANLITPPMSFFVTGKQPKLEPGELERAEAWGRALTFIVKPSLVAGSRTIES